MFFPHNVVRLNGLEGDMISLLWEHSVELTALTVVLKSQPAEAASI